MADDVIPVLIVGGGPVGLSAALMLARLGVRCMLIERWPTRLTAPKAHAINPRTLEICRALGLDRQRFAVRATPVDESLLVRFVTKLGGPELGALPYERQDDGALAATPTPLLNLAQPDFEDILAEALADEPRVTLRRGVDWQGAREADGIVTSTMGDGEIIRSRWLIAADGAQSSVRESLGIAMIGPDKLHFRLMIHFRADLSALLKDREAAIYWTMAPDAAGGFIAFNVRSNWVYMYRYDPDTVDAASFTTDDCERLVREAIIGDPGDVEIVSRGPWSLSVQLAERYRQGRIVLTGDAAHRFPPSGGLGLNTGVQDAHNLAWKIAAVEQGWGDPALIDSYENERKPIADVNASQSILNSRNMIPVFDYIAGVDARPGGLDAALGDPAVRDELTRLIEAQSPHFDSFGLQLGFTYGPERDWVDRVSDYRPSIAVGARMPHAWIELAGMRASTLDLLANDRLTLIGGPAAWIDAIEAPQGVPVDRRVAGRDFRDGDGDWAETSGLADGGALLVRPDGHILAVAASAAEASKLVTGFEFLRTGRMAT